MPIRAPTAGHLDSKSVPRAYLLSSHSHWIAPRAERILLLLKRADIELSRGRLDASLQLSELQQQAAYRGREHWRPGSLLQLWYRWAIASARSSEQFDSDGHQVAPLGSVRLHCGWHILCCFGDTS